MYLGGTLIYSAISHNGHTVLSIHETMFKIGKLKIAKSIHVTGRKVVKG
jgi:hypothetical protein